MADRRTVTLNIAQKHAQAWADLGDVANATGRSVSSLVGEIVAVWCLHNARVVADSRALLNYRAHFDSIRPEKGGR